MGSKPTAKATRQRQLSALRKLAQMSLIFMPDDAQARHLYEGLKVIKAPMPDESTRTQERTRRALTPAEAAALRWIDVDFTNGVLHIRHGKGDKRRDVPFAGDYALEALRQWQMNQPAGRVYAFCPLGRAGKIAKADRPISGTEATQRCCTPRRWTPAQRVKAQIWIPEFTGWWLECRGIMLQWRQWRMTVWAVSDYHMLEPNIYELISS